MGEFIGFIEHITFQGIIEFIEYRIQGYLKVYWVHNFSLIYLEKLFLNYKVAKRPQIMYDIFDIAL